MILAAGFGTRLGELTKRVPKCLVEAGGRTLLEHTIELVRGAGVREIVINLHHLGDQIESFVAAHGGFGMTVHFSRESSILGTGGGVKAARPHLEGCEQFFVVNSDIYTDCDLNRLAAEHRAHGGTATLFVRPRDTARVLLFDAAGELLGWRSPSGQRIVRAADTEVGLGFTGVQIASNRLFRYLEPHEGEFSIIDAYLDAARDGEAPRAFRADETYWIDAGTPERLEALRARLAAS